MVFRLKKFVKAVSKLIVVASCLLLIGILSGIYASEKLSKKRKFYKSILAFNCDFTNAVTFNRDDLSVILSNKYISEDLNLILYERLKSIGLKKQLTALPNFLSLEEKNEISEYFLKIGIFDPKTQLNLLKQYSDFFTRKLNESQNEERVRGVLYKKLGVILGLIAFVVAV